MTISGLRQPDTKEDQRPAQGTLTQERTIGFPRDQWHKRRP